MIDIDRAAVTFMVALVGLAVHYQWGGFLIGMTIGSGAMFVWYIVAPLFADRRPRQSRARCGECGWPAGSGHHSACSKKEARA